MDQNLSRIRKEYGKKRLSVAGLPDDPLVLFSDWISDALDHEDREPAAMVLSTADKNGFPSSRIVLLKGIENGHFLFFTNYKSRKSREIEENENVSLLFFWPGAERQVRISGKAGILPRSESEKYFKTRPYESRISAYASVQSAVIPSRDWLEDRIKELKKKYPEGREIPLPEYWGGFAVFPLGIEFWQGREARLHDRIEYLRNNDGWIRRRLSP